MRGVVFHGNAWEHYEKMCEDDNHARKKFHKIIKEMRRGDPSSGSGKPEPLKHNLEGAWSRRLNKKDRIVYYFDDDFIGIYSIGGHYE